MSENTTNNDNIIWLAEWRRQLTSVREEFEKKLPELLGYSGNKFTDEQSALLKAIAPCVRSNPYRDPVDVEAVWADWFFLGGVIMDIERWQQQLEAALRRAEEQRTDR